MRPNNPFLISGYYSPSYFCDRIEESKKMITALHNGRNITLIAPRRMGKTGLIKNVFFQLKEQDPDIITIYLDIYATQNLSDLVSLLANTLLGALDTTAQSIMGRVITFMKSCRPSFTFDEVTGAPSVSLDITPNQEQATLKEIFDYLGSSEKRCYIAIDEFQQIGEYPEKGVEALLRSHIQFIPNVNFIFSGSKKHVMQEMFLSSKRPFYQSTQTLSIEQIEPTLYYWFAAGFFEANNTRLHREAFDEIYQRFDGHTWYVQSILNRTYSYHADVDNALVNQAISEIVEESTYTYQHLLSSYTANNVALLNAIAKDGLVEEITSNSFISKYKLGAASSVKTSLNKLLDRELVYKTAKGYIIYDRFMAIYLRKQLF